MTLALIIILSLYSLVITYLVLRIGKDLNESEKEVERDKKIIELYQEREKEFEKQLAGLQSENFKLNNREMYKA